MSPRDRIPPTSHTKGVSQALKIRQIPDAVWDVASEIAESEKSASRHTQVMLGVRFNVQYSMYAPSFIYLGLEARTSQCPQ